MSNTHRGSCFCGAVEIEVCGAPLEMGYCHCSSCRAYSGAPMAAFMLWRKDDVRVIKGAEHLRGFNKTGFSDRHHCNICGGNVLVYHPGLEFTDVYAGILPSVPFKPTVHLNYAETVLPMKDGLPKLKGFPGDGAEILPE